MRFMPPFVPNSRSNGNADSRSSAPGRRRVLVIWLVVTCASHTAGALSPILREMEEAYVELGEKLRPSVVSVEASGSDAATDNRDTADQSLHRFFGIEGEGGASRDPKQGSGFVYTEDGYIVTNSHVVQGAEAVVVTMWDGVEYVGKLVGFDSATDLAVVKIERERPLKAVTLGDSERLRVGQFAIAVGSPQGLDSSMSFGHISGLHRDNVHLPGLQYYGLIQTDAAINLGNSGGPLCDLDGEVIGISTAVVYGADSLGFAIPVNTAKRIVPALIAHGRISRGRLGVQVRELSKEMQRARDLPFSTGAVVLAVEESAPAEGAGIRADDIIRKVNEIEIRDDTHLRNAIRDIPAGQVVTIEVFRAGATVRLDATLAEDAPEPNKSE